MARLEPSEMYKLLDDPKYNIPWDDLKRWGLTADSLVKEDIRQNAYGAVVKQFVNHGYSPVFKVRPDYKSNDISITGELFGAVRFYQSGGQTKIDFQIARPEYRLEDDIYINEHTVLHADASDPEEKLAHDNLIKTGFANMPVMVKDPRWSREAGGMTQPCLVALDRSDDRRRGTNQAQYVRQSWVEGILNKHDNKICGAVITPAERKAYLAGEAVFIKGMTKWDKSTFDGYVRFNPVSGMSTFNAGLAQKETKAEHKSVEVSETQQEEVKQAKTRSRGIH